MNFCLEMKFIVVLFVWFMGRLGILWVLVFILLNVIFMLDVIVFWVLDIIFGFCVRFGVVVDISVVLLVSKDCWDICVCCKVVFGCWN